MAAPTPAPAPAMATPIGSVADELQKLAGFRDAGVLSPEEFEAQKAKLLGCTRVTVPRRSALRTCHTRRATKPATAPAGSPSCGRCSRPQPLCSSSSV